MSEVAYETDVPVLESTEEVLVTPPSVGETLKAARQAKGLEIAAVAQSMKLSPRQVEALEADRWDSLPGTTVIRGFVRNYARFIGIDAMPLMSQLDAQLDGAKPRLDLPPSVPTTMSHAGKPERRDYAFALLGVAFVVVAILAYLLLPNDLSSWREGLKETISELSRPAPPAAVPVSTQPEAVLPPGTSVQEVINPQATPDAQPATETPAPAGAESARPADPAKPAEAPKPAETTKPAATAPLVFNLSKESWVEVRDRSGNVLLSQRVPANAERQVEGSGPFSIVLGNAPGVSIKFKGQPVDLAPYTKGDVARLTLE